MTTLLTSSIHFQDAGHLREGSDPVDGRVLIVGILIVADGVRVRLLRKVLQLEVECQEHLTSIGVFRNEVENCAGLHRVRGNERKEGRDASERRVFEHSELGISSTIVNGQLTLPTSCASPRGLSTSMVDSRNASRTTGSWDLRSVSVKLSRTTEGLGRSCIS